MCGVFGVCLCRVCEDVYYVMWVDVVVLLCINVKVFRCLLMCVTNQSYRIWQVFV